MSINEYDNPFGEPNKKFKIQRRKPPASQQRTSGKFIEFDEDMSSSNRRRPSPRPTIASIPPPADIDPYSSCPPPPPGYDGNWYNDCLRILGIR